MAEKLRFDHRHGAAPLPSQLTPHELSEELKAKVWAVLHRSLEGSKRYIQEKGQTQPSSKWIDLLYGWHVEVEHRPADEFKSDYTWLAARAKSAIYHYNFGRFYTFLEMIAEAPNFQGIAHEVSKALESSRAAWRLVGAEIIPITSEEQAEAAASALAVVTDIGPEGAKSHLRNNRRAFAEGVGPEASVRASTR